MYLRPSDFYMQLLRPVGVRGSEFTFSDVRTRHVTPLRFYDTDCFFGGLSFGGSPFGGRIV